MWADSGYSGKLVDWAAATLGLNLQIRKLAEQVGFVVLHEPLGFGARTSAS